MNAIALPSAVTATQAHPRMSDRYVHINSSTVIDLMASEGFLVAGVTMPKPSRAGKLRIPEFARHQIDFRRADWEANPHQGRRGAATPRVLFSNSHDGSAAASFMMGVYSFVCSNGLVVGSTYAKERVRHAGETAAALIGRMQDLARNTGPLFDQIDTWSDKILTVPQMREFARLSSVLRWGDDQRFTPDEVLRVRRAEDDDASLWSVFNRIQENTVKGGLAGMTRTGRGAVSRPLVEVAKNTKFNADLWHLAEEFAAL